MKIKPKGRIPEKLYVVVEQGYTISPSDIALSLREVHAKRGESEWDPDLQKMVRRKTAVLEYRRVNKGAKK